MYYLKNLGFKAVKLLTLILIMTIGVHVNAQEPEPELESGQGQDISSDFQEDGLPPNEPSQGVGLESDQEETQGESGLFGKSKGWYLGAQLGVSEFDPILVDTGFSLAEERDQGFRLFTGLIFSPDVLLELSYEELGKAELINLVDIEKNVSYQHFGASGLWFPGKENGYFKERDWRWYLMMGLGSLEDGGSAFTDKERDLQIHFGAGLEYEFVPSWNLRLSTESYDKDARSLWLGVSKVFSNEYKKQPEPVEELEPEPIFIDEDQDDVEDSLDCCLGTRLGVRVNSKGCPLLEMRLKEVNFASGSFSLLPDSKRILDDVADSIYLYEYAILEVGAHSDSIGSNEVNMMLSEKRADSVSKYLISKGVAEKSLVVRGYGEEQPIADNDTLEGREMNRRVEIKVLDPGIDEETGCPVVKNIYVEEEGVETFLQNSSNNIRFAYGSYHILSSSLPTLDRLAEQLINNPDMIVEVGAHTDSIGSKEHNLKLSTRRANQVYEHLVHKGVRPDQIFAVGYGEDKPVADNGTSGGREQNRRVEIKIVPKGGMEESVEAQDAMN